MVSMTWRGWYRMERAIKIKDGFIFLKKSKIKAGEGLAKGDYPFYTSSSALSKYLDSYEIEEESLIFGSGGTASIHHSHGKFSTSTDCFVVQSNSKFNIDLKYAYLYLLGNIHILENGFKGAGLKHISKKYLENVEIPLPPIEIQKKIVASLDKAQELADARKEQIRLMDELSRSVFYEMFSDYEKYPQKSIASVCRAIYDCPHSTPKYSDSKTSFRCLRTSNLGNGYIDWDNLAYVDENTYNERNKRYTPKVGDVVYSREGAILGIAALVNDTKSMCLGQRLMIFTLDNKLVNSIFFWMLLNSQIIRRQVELNIGGAAAPRINIKDIKKFEIFLPPIEVQNEFSEKISKIEEIKKELSLSLNDINNTYQSLLQKAFKGKLCGV